MASGEGGKRPRLLKRDQDNHASLKKQSLLRLHGLILAAPALWQEGKERGRLTMNLGFRKRGQDPQFFP